jgi:hypothetical protein
VGSGKCEVEGPGRPWVVTLWVMGERGVEFIDDCRVLIFDC